VLEVVVLGERAVAAGPSRHRGGAHAPPGIASAWLTGLGVKALDEWRRSAAHLDSLLHPWRSGHVAVAGRAAASGVIRQRPEAPAARASAFTIRVFSDRTSAKATRQSPTRRPADERSATLAIARTTGPASASGRVYPASGRLPRLARGNEDRGGAPRRDFHTTEWKHCCAAGAATTRADRLARVQLRKLQLRGPATE